MNRLLSHVVTTCLVIAALFLVPQCEVNQDSTPEERKRFAQRLTGTWTVAFASGEAAVLEMRAYTLTSFGGCDARAVRWLSTAFACGELQPGFALLRGKATSDKEHLRGELQGKSRLRKYFGSSDEAEVEVSFGDMTLVGRTSWDGSMRGTAKNAKGQDLGSFEALKTL